MPQCAVIPLPFPAPDPLPDPLPVPVTLGNTDVAVPRIPPAGHRVRRQRTSTTNGTSAWAWTTSSTTTCPHRRWPSRLPASGPRAHPAEHVPAGPASRRSAQAGIRDLLSGPEELWDFLTPASSGLCHPILYADIVHPDPADASSRSRPCFSTYACRAPSGNPVFGLPAGRTARLGWAIDQSGNRVEGYTPGVDPLTGRRVHDPSVDIAQPGSPCSCIDPAGCLRT